MFKLRPSILIASSFLIMILLGGFILSLPISSSTGTPTNLIDAFFTSNSATCVTGLVTLDTGTHFSLFGIFVILFLIQIGGLGYMTFATFIVLVFRHKLFISQKFAIKEALNIYSTKDIISLLKKIFGIVFIVESIGAVILFIRWLPEFGAKKAALYAGFHSISAFNNAGFALPANFASLMPYVTDITINLTITSLIIIGGLGFIVIADIIDRRRLALQSKIVIVSTLFLIIIGAIFFFFLEYNNPNTLGPLSAPHKIMASYFQAVTPRTAGFTTLDFTKIFPSTALITMFLMFVGASPGGTGGGIKTTTFALILLTIFATLKGSRNTIIFNRRIPPETVRRAITITFLALALLAFAIFILNSTEHFGIMELSFEAFSAFGTVGLTLGITPNLSAAGKLVIMSIMFIGRVGILTLLLALTIDQKEPKIKPPKEGISIG